MWAGQRPGLQDISGGANFGNKADNAIVVHRDWSRLKELQQRSAAAAGAGKRPRGAARATGSAAAADAGEQQEQEARDLWAECEVQIVVEKVSCGVCGCVGLGWRGVRLALVRVCGVALVP
jgi:hypothetical protein